MATLKLHSLLLAALVSLPPASPTYAQDLITPVFHPQDTWAYRLDHQVNGMSRQTHIEISVIRSGSMGLLVGIKEAGSTLPPREQLFGSDWSHARSIDGKEQTTSRPFKFPLSEEKSWELEYTEDHPNRVHKSEHVSTKYVVTGWEEISVPAGTYKALKIEADGQWTAELEPAVSTATATRSDEQGTTAAVQANKVLPKTATGRLYKAYWYVPDVKRWVKSIEEIYASNGTLSMRNTEELEAVKLAQ